MASFNHIGEDGDMKNRLREIREEKGLTLEEVAELVETSNQQIFRLEMGQRKLTLEWLSRLSAALGVSPLEIVPDLAEKAKKESIEVSVLESDLRDMVQNVYDNAIKLQNDRKKK
jgi:transcriptional regulator with XRE-family HTH domain